MVLPVRIGVVVMFTADHLGLIATGIGFLVLSLVCLMSRPRLVGIGVLMGVASLVHGALTLALLLFVF